MTTNQNRDLKLHRFAVSVVMACDVRGFTPSEISRILGMVFDYGVASEALARGKIESEINDELLNLFLDASIQQKLSRDDMIGSRVAVSLGETKAVSPEEFLATLPVCEMGPKQ